jgi:hypothetical protein
MASNSKYGFGKAKKRFVELALPSVDEETGEHHVVLVRRPDPMIMIDEGLLDDFDTLTGIVGLKIKDIEGKTPAERDAAETAQLKAFAENIAAVQDGLALMDRMVCAVVVEPVCRRPFAIERNPDGSAKLDARGRVVYLKNQDGKEIPILDTEREDEIIYTDEIPVENRTFILNYAVGGTRDLESFREGLDSTVERMADVSPIQQPTLGSLLA